MGKSETRENAKFEFRIPKQYRISKRGKLETKSDRYRTVRLGLVVAAVGVLLGLCGARAAEQSGEAKKRFAPVKVFIDPQGKGLGAYQFELKAVNGSARIVGVEGGEHAAYKEAPYYDTAALAKDMMIIGALSTAKELPTGRTCVATVHMMIEGNTAPEYEVVLMTAGDSDGNRIDAKISLETGESK